MSDYSADFYRKHARRYAEIAHQYLQSVYVAASHPDLKGDIALLERLKELAPGRRGLDAGHGAGARDVFYLWQDHYDMWGVDAIVENVDMAREMHPDIANRIQVHDLRAPLPYPDDHFHFVLCNAVIQHIAPEDVYATVLPELVRVLQPNGVLQLMFKNGEGINTVYDKDYRAYRTFQLYNPDTILGILNEKGAKLIESEDDQLGGIMYFTDPKPIEHCVFWVRKQED
jgi:SAM-dependent methyltransferase